MWRGGTEARHENQFWTFRSTNSTKSPVLRVTRISSLTFAIAAIRPSKCRSGSSAGPRKLPARAPVAPAVHFVRRQFRQIEIRSSAPSLDRLPEVPVRSPGLETLVRVLGDRNRYRFPASGDVDDMAVPSRVNQPRRRTSGFGDGYLGHGLRQIAKLLATLNQFHVHRNPPVGTSVPLARSRSRRGRTSESRRARYPGRSRKNSRIDAPTRTVTPSPPL